MPEPNPYRPPTIGAEPDSRICGRCRTEMTVGFVSSAHPIEWVDPDASAFEVFRRGREKLAGASFSVGPFKLRAFRCEKCRFIHVEL